MGVTWSPAQPPAPQWFELAHGMVLLRGSLLSEQASGTLRLMPETLRIGHVRLGGCAIVLPDGSRLRAVEGDVAIVSPEVGAVGIELRGGRAEGLVLSVDCGRLPASIRRVFAGLEVNVESIRRMVPPERPVLVTHATPECARVFAETYRLVNECDVGHVRLKAIEMLGCLSASPSATTRGRVDRGVASTRARHACIALRAQKEMMGDVSDPKTIPTLAALCDTSPTVLKEAFRETFGIPLHAWYREYRVRVAARALLEGDSTIAEVAASVGYSNPSKFAGAFFDIMGATPREWRATHGKDGVGTKARPQGTR
ncbi:MAG: helix-turn-helix domain-containing protein [Parafannyhessea sp.]|uniref:helix-turn-helix domain-containing protein n=1 Tax=Parafannyhessea sp. TaxID=2847324 RepID=UPI003F00B8FF